MIGTVGTDDQGLTGLEAADNGLLGAASGERAVTVDGLGKEIERNTVSQRPARRGPEADDRRRDPGANRAGAGDVVGQTYQPKGATAIVMNPRNSQILAMAELADGRPQRPRRRQAADLQNMATGVHV